MTKNSTAPRVSSPAATGGAGTFFEQHVDAYWLGQLLVRAIPPILRDCAVVEVHLQTERLGWQTDDFLVIGETGSGSRRKLAGQVKRTFTVSATDDECRKAMLDFWADFKNLEFAAPVDRLALITLRGTNTLLEYFAGLLDCARAASDPADFERRLATPGLLSAKAVGHCETIRAILGEAEGRSLTAADIWPFLRVLHVLSLDLNSATGQTEAAIKSLLAHTAGGEDAVGAADESWNTLLREVGSGMQEGRSYRRDNLPESVVRRHSPVTTADQRALRALSDHSSLVLDGIRTTIGDDFHLQRAGLVQEVISKLESAQVVLVSGPAGSGKSGIAKDAVEVLNADHFVFAFRAEEFKCASLDEMLQRIQIPANAAGIAAVLAAQGRKVLLVESAERLLEASTRDAFSDLLTFVARDRNWQLVLTCRDYSSDLVRACFLEAARIGHSVVTVTPLDDGELKAVEAAYPQLARPLASDALRRLLRNPYVLDKALRITWSADRSLPQSEREFRARFWQELVRADHHAGGGMPRRREEAFVQIALRRARALTLYPACGDLDPAVNDALARDSLVVASRQSSTLLAPAHDVLEDWAILQWIDEQYATHEGSLKALSDALGTYPAVRRTYRKWVSELVGQDSGAADRLFEAVVRERDLTPQFRDDTIVSLLRSAASATMLERHRAALFANDKRLLLRVIHLLRVACVTSPAWLETTTDRPSLYNVPDGPAWASMLELVRSNLDSFAEGDYGLLLGLIEDWARGVCWQCPYPSGAEATAAIGHWLLQAFDDYSSEDERKRTLQVIAKIPNADREHFAALLQARSDGEARDRAAEDFQEILFEGLDGFAAGRDVPEIVVAAATDYLLCSEGDLRDEWGYGGATELEPLFGIKRGRTHNFFPASAYRGPFLALLRNNPSLGIDLFITVFNHSAEWYAHPRVQSEYVEPPYEITLSFADGTTRPQWCNSRLWCLYRGMSGGPYVLQCLLMALERWLLEFAGARPRELDDVLLRILRRSESTALTSVAASLATAFPRLAAEALLVLLSAPACIRLDRGRLAAEAQSPSRMAELLLPRLNSRNKVYEDERKEAGARPHRHSDLETAIVNLQLGPLAERVTELLDRHRGQMPPIAEQSEEDRVWRLALHRMDLRQYSVAEDIPSAPASADTQANDDGGMQSVRLNLNEPEPDVKAMADESAAEFRALNARLGLFMWGHKAFDRDAGAGHDPAQWRSRLQEARGAGDRDGGDDLGRGGPEFVAAVCVRDHWEEMTDVDRGWCVNTVCAEVVRQADLWNRFARMQRSGLSAEGACAWVLPMLLGKSLTGDQMAQVSGTLVVALTHAIDEVRSHAASGIGKLWTIDRELTVRCVNALSAEASLVQEAVDVAAANRMQARNEDVVAECHDEGWVDKIEAGVAADIRRRFFEVGGIPDDALQTLDPTRWFGAEANIRILAILGQAPVDEPASTAGFERLAQTLVAWWDAEDERRGQDHNRHPERNHETESALLDLLQSFLMRTTANVAATILQPILAAVDRHPREIRWILMGLIGTEDRSPNTPQFWAIWRLFADSIRRADWLDDLDHEHPIGGELLSAAFLGTWWKEEVRHWRSVEGHADNVHTLFDDLPASSMVLDDYLNFLYHVGEQSLPAAFVRIARRLQRGDPSRMLQKGNTVYLLEVLLQRFVYGKPLALKRDRDLREAVLILLDMLVERGSSAAFRMRDDFVTPVTVPTDT